MRTVQGTVHSEGDGEPVIGASIIVKGTTLGTITNANGKFELRELPPTATQLIISITVR